MAIAAGDLLARSDAASLHGTKRLVPPSRRMPMAAAKALHAMSRQMRSALLEMTMATMDAAAGAMMAMWCSRIVHAMAAMRAVSGTTRSRLAGSTEGPQAARTVRRNLRNCCRVLGRKFWQVVWHQAARGRRRTDDIGEPRISLRLGCGRRNRGDAESEAEHPDRTQHTKHHVTAGETPACGHVPSSLRHSSPGRSLELICFARCRCIGGHAACEKYPLEGISICGGPRGTSGRWWRRPDAATMS